MQTTTISITTEPTVKKEAQKVAEELGLSLSVLVNKWLKQFVKTKSTTLDPYDGEEPNERTIALMKRAEKDRKAGKGSPIFDNVEDSIKWLEKQGI